MKHLFAMTVLVLSATQLLAAGEIIESIPNENGDWSTLYAQKAARCKGSNFFADATDDQGHVTGRG
jgi:hypothetical protein